MLTNRGPDKSDRHFVRTPSFDCSFSGHVLWQQGVNLCSQPILHEQHVLLLNGDIYTKRPNSHIISDTQWLMEVVAECNQVFISSLLYFTLT